MDKCIDELDTVVSKLVRQKFNSLRPGLNANFMVMLGKATVKDGECD
jgi:hypothetical protein